MKPAVHWDVLIPADVIQRRIAEMATDVQLCIDQARSSTPVAVVPVALGGIWFGMQLVQRLNPETFHWGLVGTSSYGKDEIGGKVDMSFNRTGDLSGHSVIIVDDIGDRRRTLEFLNRHFLGTQQADAVFNCVLLDKPSRQEVDAPLHFVGFEIPDTFVAGCGLDGGSGFAHTRNYSEVRYKRGTLPKNVQKYKIPTQAAA